MRIRNHSRDIRITFGRIEFIIYKWFPYEIRKVVYGDGTDEMAARRARQFRLEAQQALARWAAESEAARAARESCAIDGGTAGLDGSGIADANAPVPGGERTVPDVPKEGVI